MRSTLALVPLLAPMLSLALAACGDSGTAEKEKVAAPAASAPTATGTPAAQASVLPDEAKKIAHDRHEKFEEMGDAFKDISDEMKKGSPDMARIQAAAATINGLAPQVRTWFPAGSGPEDGIKTDALQTVWTKPAEFRQGHERLVAEAAKFHATAQSGDKAAIAEGMKALGGACKNCHDQFREKE